MLLSKENSCIFLKKEENSCELAKKKRAVLIT